MNKQLDKKKAEVNHLNKALQESLANVERANSKVNRYEKEIEMLHSKLKESEFVYTGLTSEQFDVLWNFLQPSIKYIDEYMPDNFKPSDAKTRIVLDCTEIKLQSASNSDLQYMNFS